MLMVTPLFGAGASAIELRAGDAGTRGRPRPRPSERRSRVLIEQPRPVRRHPRHPGVDGRSERGQAGRVLGVQMRLDGSLAGPQGQPEWDILPSLWWGSRQGITKPHNLLQAEDPLVAPDKAISLRRVARDALRIDFDPGGDQGTAMFVVDLAREVGGTGDEVDRRKVLLKAQSLAKDFIDCVDKELHALAHPA